MIRLLRQGTSIPREDAGAVRFDDLVEEFKAKFDGSSQWPVNAWTTFLAKACISEQFRDTQEIISLILHCKTMCCFRMTSLSTSTTSEMRVEYVRWSKAD